MAPRPRWTVPVNMRSQDKDVLDAAMRIAKSEGSDITTVFRTALAEFVRTRASQTAGRKMDEFLDNSEMANPVYQKILTPVMLGKWSVDEIFHAAKLVRSRKQELDFELRRRGYFFSW